jgi:hypothetical protein
MGSCFSDNIGNLLESNKLKVKINPFGVIFNPISLINLLEWSKGEATLEDQHFFESDGVWKHLDFHSSIFGASRKELESKLEELRAEVGEWLEKTDFLLLTFGTAWVYEFTETRKTVANCHKLPSSQFQKRLLSVEEIETTVSKLQKLLSKQTKVILTVSPIRHLKDTIPLNSVSKSILRFACHQLTKNSKQFQYFPSYEIMLDDLRDYRFYEPDMIHPSEVAINYIWEAFTKAYFDSEGQSFLLEWQKIKSGLNHKAFQPNSESHQKFLKSLLHKLEILSSKINVSEEILTIKGQLIG